MKKEQALGQIRTFLTAAGTVLATWGISDGNGWAPVTGVIVALISLLWGIAFHRDPNNPGKLKWSLLRKFINVAGSAAVTYSFVSQDRVDAMMALVAALGPLAAATFSWVSNDDGRPAGSRLPVILFLAALSVLLFPSCSGFDYSARVFVLDPESGAKGGLTFSEDGTEITGRFVDEYGNHLGGSVFIPKDSIEVVPEK
jgi:hypothetical protein